MQVMIYMRDIQNGKIPKDSEGLERYSWVQWVEIRSESCF